MSRQKRTAIWIGVFGVGAGAGLFLWWQNHKKQAPAITSSGAGVKRVSVSAISTPDAYTKGSAANKALTAAQDGWYRLHPDEPFVNDDGSCNILPEFDDGDIPGCLNQSPPSD